MLLIQAEMTQERYVWIRVCHWLLLVSVGWFPCCSLLSMMLIRSPSCCFMCSISCSLLVDSKPQIQQQKSSTQYSIPARVCPEPLRHATAPPASSLVDDGLMGLPSCPPEAEATSGDCLSFLVKTIYGRSIPVSCVDFRGVVGDLNPRRKQRKENCVSKAITFLWDHAICWVLPSCVCEF